MEAVGDILLACNAYSFGIGLSTHKPGKLLVLKPRTGGIGETPVLKEQCKAAFYLAQINCQPGFVVLHELFG
jgi:hypothetical protein